MQREGPGLFELVAEHAPIGIFMNDAAGQCVYVNRRCCEKLGAPAAAIMGAGWTRALHPEDRERVLTAWRRAVKTGGSFESEYRFNRPDGSTLWVYGKVAAVTTRRGTTAGYIGTIADITARKTAELALAESQIRLQALLEERERLDQDLHDSCIQAIFAVGLSLEAALPLVARNPSRVAATIGNAAANLDLVIQDLRAYISGAGPPAAGIRDFRAEIERTVQALGSHARRFAIDIDAAAAEALSPEQAWQMLHIAREGISNIVRHARARAARVALHLRDHVVRLEVSDDGRGFDFRNRARRGMGLHHIQARARKLGARCRIVSSAGHGSRVVVALHLAS